MPLVGSTNEASKIAAANPPRFDARRFWTVTAVGIAIFLGALFVYLASSVTQSYDSRWSIYSAISYLRGDGGNLTAFSDVVESVNGYGTEIVDGQLRSYFPEGPTFLAMPFVALLRWIHPAFDNQLTPSLAALVEKTIASGYCALACLLMFAAIYRHFNSVALAAAAAVVMAFATPLWSTASRALWQHGPVIFCLATAIWVLEESTRRRGLIALFGVPLALAVICRPTAIVPTVVLSIVPLLFYRRYFLWFLAPAALIALLWIWHNLAVFHALTPSYYSAERIATTTTFWEALVGNLMSPGRGLFVFSPVLLFALAAPFLPHVPVRDRAVAIGCVALLTIHLVAVSLFPHWWAGHSYGPRLMSDMTPFLIVGVSIAASTFLQTRGMVRVGALSVASVLTIASVGANSGGALRQATLDWNATPVDVDTAPTRLWDWSDLQFLR